MTLTHLSTHLVNLLGLNDIIVSFQPASSNILLSSMSFLPSNHHSKNCSSLPPVLFHWFTSLTSMNMDWNLLLQQIRNPARGSEHVVRNHGSLRAMKKFEKVSKPPSPLRPHNLILKMERTGLVLLMCSFIAESPCFSLFVHYQFQRTKTKYHGTQGIHSYIWPSCDTNVSLVKM